MCPFCNGCGDAAVSLRIHNDTSVSCANYWSYILSAVTSSLSEGIQDFLFLFSSYTTLSYTKHKNSYF
jgi:hypothetical protein